MENKWKLVQFAIVSILLNKSKPMTNYQDFLSIYEFVKFWFNPKKHWHNGVGWEVNRLNFLIIYSLMTQEDIASSLVCFDVDGGHHFIRL